MLLNIAQESDVIGFSGVNAQQKSFSIAMNAKAFRTLSDSIYKNKIGSIVREISCNALDAHMQAGKPNEPFIIHVPNTFEPWFSVQDFGVGLSQDDIEGTEKVTEHSWYEENNDGTYRKVTDGTMVRTREGGIYTTMFGSTKDQNPDAIGAYGLGSKTPLAYTDAFTLTSVKDGMKYHYSVFLDAGIPAVLLLASEATDEPNGVKVEIPVRKEHFGTFEDEIVRQLQFLTVKPTIINGTIYFDDKFEDSGDFFVATENVRIVKDRDARYNIPDYYAVLGPVGYPLEIEHINEHLTKEQKSFLNEIDSRTAFYFNIGEVEVVASREGISYTDKSIKAIVEKIEIARKETLDHILKSVKLDGTDWENACILNDFGVLTKLFIASGHEIATATTYNEKYGFDAFKAQVFNPTTNRRSYSLAKYDEGKNSEKLYRTANGVQYVTASSNAVFFVRDTTKKPIARLNEYNIQNQGKDIYVFERVGALESDEEVFFTPEEIQEFSKVLGGVAIQNISDLPEPPRKPRATNDGSSGSGSSEGPSKHARGYLIPINYVRKLGDRRVNFGEKLFDDVEDLEPGIYIPADRGIPILQGKLYGEYYQNECDIIYNINIVFNALGKELPPIYVLSQRSVVKVQKIEGWKLAQTFIDETLDELKIYETQVNAYRARHEVKRELRKLLPSAYYNRFLDKQLVRRLDKDSVATYPIRLMRITGKRQLENHKLETLIDKFGYLFKKDQTLVQCVMEKIELAQQALPFLGNLPSMWDKVTDAQLEHAIKYINVMGKA